MSIRLSSLVKELQRIPPARVSEATEIFVHPETFRDIALSAETLTIFGVGYHDGGVTFCGKLIKLDASVSPGKIELR